MQSAVIIFQQIDYIGTDETEDQLLYILLPILIFENKYFQVYGFRNVLTRSYRSSNFIYFIILITLCLTKRIEILKTHFLKVEIT